MTTIENLNLMPLPFQNPLSPFFADFDRDAYETLKEDMAEKVDEHWTAEFRYRIYQD